MSEIPLLHQYASLEKSFFISPGDAVSLPMKSFWKVLHTKDPGLWGTVCQSLGYNSCLEAASTPLFLWVPFHDVLRRLGKPTVIESVGLLLVGFVDYLIQSLKSPTNVHSFMELSHEELRLWGCWQPHPALALWSEWPVVLQGQLD